MWPHKKINLYSHYTASLFVRRTQCMPTGMLHELEDRQTPSFRTGHLVEQRYAANTTAKLHTSHFSCQFPAYNLHTVTLTQWPQVAQPPLQRHHWPKPLLLPSLLVHRIIRGSRKVGQSSTPSLNLNVTS